ncbi:Protein involved in sister chromatid separation and/or segregation protein [Dioscorea alata]|uniref:Protein involved in sister chromatid separation and/or segregation protein n=1 Tax=Dioscorea alata TaxID=55571 RepID=A0ACB7WMU0_DIOAL|nr:Protein involved in sister chromatid separation and/or segregation protein [Dioscorea alata]
MEGQDIANIMVIWRGRQLNVEVNADSKVKDFGLMLQKLTDIKADTLRLLVPQLKASKMIIPFSDSHSNLTLREVSILEGKPIRMMGVFDNEIEEVSQNSSKPDLRIAGFDEEEKRMRQRMGRPVVSLKLPTGPYIFGNFQTLDIPGIELNPPPSEALKRMHMLACDPGIIAIMNKHRWRVGIMTEMAPEGYVGISPKCILGFNKNHGEEISLRLRTDDLKGFRKYDSIKKTLLHELAHMVYSEHDANFYALDKQLNQEAESLDWTKSKGHTLSGRKVSDYYEDDIAYETVTDYEGQKLGGSLNALATARASSVAAAYYRSMKASTNVIATEDNHATEPDPDDNELRIDQEKIYAEPDPDDTVDIREDRTHISIIRESDVNDEPDPDDCFDHENTQEHCQTISEPDPDDSLIVEPDPDDSISNGTDLNHKVILESATDEAEASILIDDGSPIKHVLPGKNCDEPDPDDSVKNNTLMDGNQMEIDEPDPDDSTITLDNEELRIIEEPVAAICARLQKAIVWLRSEAPPAEAASVLQTLSKIIRNVIDHPDNMKFRKLRKVCLIFYILLSEFMFS